MEHSFDQNRAESNDHPFSPGTRVRHSGRHWNHLSFATVVEVKPFHDGSFEYIVEIDNDANFGPIGTRVGQWSSNFTLGEEIDTSLEAIDV